MKAFGSGMVALLEHQSHTGDNKGVVCVKVNTVVMARLKWSSGRTLGVYSVSCDNMQTI